MEKLTSDDMILQYVKGVRVHFNIKPKQYFKPKPINFNSEEHSIIANEIRNLLDKKVIEKCTHEPGEYISTIFIRKKKSRKYRLIINLKCLNNFVT